MIVDAKSKDNTVKLIKEFSKNNKDMNIKLIIKKAPTIGMGRNIGMKFVKNDIIFSGDLGTRFDKNYFERMLKGFDKGSDIVIGVFRPEKSSNYLEKVVGVRVERFFHKLLNKKGGMKIASNRHAAFTREVYEKAGPYPEKILRADDTLFYKKASKLGFKYSFIKNAYVYWRSRSNWKDLFLFSFYDSVSEVRLGVFENPHKVVLKLIFGVYFFGVVAFTLLSLNFFNLILLLPVFAANVFEGGISTYRVLKTKKALLYGTVVSFVLLIAHFLGLVVGALKYVYVDFLGFSNFPIRG